jgi:hypothetical protein
VSPEAVRGPVAPETPPNRSVDRAGAEFRSGATTRKSNHYGPIGGPPRTGATSTGPVLLPPYREDRSGPSLSNQGGGWEVW